MAQGLLKQLAVAGKDGRFQQPRDQRSGEAIGLVRPMCFGVIRPFGRRQIERGAIGLKTPEQRAAMLQGQKAMEHLLASVESALKLADMRRGWSWKETSDNGDKPNNN